MDADGKLREMPDMVTLGRIAELNAIIVLGSELKVPQSSVSSVGHYTPEKSDMAVDSGVCMIGIPGEYFAIKKIFAGD